MRMVREQTQSAATATSTHCEVRALFPIPIAFKIGVGKANVTAVKKIDAAYITETNVVGIAGIWTDGMVGVETAGIGDIDVMDVVESNVVDVGGAGGLVGQISRSRSWFNFLAHSKDIDPAQSGWGSGEGRRQGDGGSWRKH